MATEIERKFLVSSDNWRQEADAGHQMRQGYLAGTQKASIRIRVSGDEARLNIKSATLGITRQEYEFTIPLVDADAMLNSLVDGPLIEKTRYHVHYGEHTWEIDEFHGDNAGLVVAEIELNHVDEDFPRPGWLGEEVSEDPRYYNVSLVKHPYCRW